MRKFFILIMLMGMLALSSTTIAANMEPPIPPNLHHNYSSTLFINGKPAITITHQYIGKAPRGKYTSKHNYKVIDTDFYNETTTNHTPYVIEFLQLKTWPERATTGVNINTRRGIKRKSSIIIIDLSKLWRNNKFPPHRSSVKRNTYYYSKNKSWNRRYLQYKVRINGRIYKFVDTLVYIR